MGLEDQRETLRKHGLRATAARLRVYEALSLARGPVSHADVCADVPEFDRATVYRNLVDLTDAGLLVRRDHGDRVWRFEMTSPHEHEVDHAHFVCTSCGQTRCLPHDTIQVSRPSDLPGPVEEIQVELRGVCQRCR